MDPDDFLNVLGDLFKSFIRKSVDALFGQSNTGTAFLSIAPTCPFPTHEAKSIVDLLQS